jgi:hypothetical protein
LKKLLTTCLLIATVFTIYAQNDKSQLVETSKRKSYFLYEEATSPLNSNCKILLVSSYIYRIKYEGNYNDVSSKLYNAANLYAENALNNFNRKLADIEFNERVYDKGIAKDLRLTAQKADAYWDVVYANGHCPNGEKFSIPQQKNVWKYSQQCRETFISDKRKEGYHVFQVTFDEYYGKHDSTLEDNISFTTVIDEVEKLSPLDVEVYRKEVISSLPDYGQYSGEINKPGSIMVTGTETTTTLSSSRKTKKSTSSSETSEYVPRQWCIDKSIQIDQLYAKALDPKTATLTSWKEVITAIDEYYADYCNVDYNIDLIRSEAVARDQEQTEAMVATFDAVSSVLSIFNWEIKGSTSTYINEEDFPGEKYNVDEVRLNFTLGRNRLRLSFSPLGFAWVKIPNFKKLTDEGVVIGEGEFGSTRFYSPSLGLMYCFMTNSEREVYYRTIEFPLAVSINPLLSAKNTDLITTGDEDTKIGDYFSNFNFYANATLGINVYFSDGFGIGIAAGISYIAIKPTKEDVINTDSSGNTSTFKVMIDEEKNIVPVVDLKLIYRFN